MEVTMVYWLVDTKVYKKAVWKVVAMVDSMVDLLGLKMDLSTAGMMVA